MGEKPSDAVGEGSRFVITFMLTDIVLPATCWLNQRLEGAPFSGNIQLNNLYQRLRFVARKPARK